MTDSEFIAKIASGECGKNEVLRYLEECPSKEYLRDAILVEHTRMMCGKNDIPIIPNGGIINNYNVDAPLAIEAMRLFDALQWLDEALTQPQPAPADGTKAQIPIGGVELDRINKYFNRAINNGYMERTESGYNWKFGGTRRKVRLGYFLQKVYCPQNKGTMPESELNALFGVKRIGSAVTQFCSGKQSQKWIRTIDEAIFYD